MEEHACEARLPHINGNVVRRSVVPGRSASRCAARPTEAPPYGSAARTSCTSGSPSPTTAPHSPFPPRVRHNCCSSVYARFWSCTVTNTTITTVAVQCSVCSFMTKGLIHIVTMKYYSSKTDKIIFAGKYLCFFITDPHNPNQLNLEHQVPFNDNKSHSMITSPIQCSISRRNIWI